MNRQYQTALSSLARLALANIELPALLRETAALAARTLAAPYSAIWAMLPGHAGLALHEGSGWPAETSAVIATTQSSLGWAMLQFSPVLTIDWPRETRLEQPHLLREHGVISSLIVCIPGAGCAFGSLSVDATSRRTFSGEEVLFLQAAAAMLALAIERTQTNQKEQQARERTQQIEQQLVAAAQKQAVLEERQRLARDLHDAVTQALYGVTLHAEVARRLLAAGDVANATGYLRALQEAAQEALDEMRLLIFELRPPILEQAGLVAALQARLSAVEGRANVETQLTIDGVETLPAAIEQALYRITQEALNNALKHARAKHIVVQLSSTGSRVMLEIADDGIGFDPAIAGQNGGMGLCGIEERVRHLGGVLSIQSAPGAGSRLQVELLL